MPTGPGSQRLKRVLFHLGAPLFIGALLGTNQTGIAVDLPWELGVLFWIVLTLGVWTLAELGTTGLAKLLRPWRPPALLLLVLGLFLATLPARPLIYAYAELFGPWLLHGRTVRHMAPLSFNIESILMYLRLWSGVYIVWIGTNYFFDRFLGLPRLRYDLEPLAPASAVPPAGGSAPAGAAAASSPGTGFLDRLPAHLGKDLVALKAEDHYVLTCTLAGKALILYRMGDAIDELQQLRGLRVHRSYWINLDALARVESTGRGHVAVMKNGLRVPVSAGYRDALRARGLLP